MSQMDLNNSLLPLCMFKYVSLILYVHICTEHMSFAMCIYVYHWFFSLTSKLNMMKSLPYIFYMYSRVMFLKLK